MLLKSLAVALLALSLVSCGGGGGGGGAEERYDLSLPAGWRKIDTAPWAWRDGAGLLAKDGGLYLLGGWNGDGEPVGSEVWFTTDLVNWELRTRNAPWPDRHGAGWVVHQDRLYVIGGDFLDDVWSSADGVNWTQHAASAPFGKRYAPNAVSHNGELLFYNGMNWDGSGAADVWASADGDAWQHVADVPYPPRGLIHGSVVHNGRIYTIAGGLKGGNPTDTTFETADVWSSADGRTWVKEADNAGFEPRYHAATLGTSHGCYVANGSVETQLNTTGEVFFAADCVNFTSIESPMPDVHATSMAEFNGTIVILGGHGDQVGSAVWQYDPGL